MSFEELAEGTIAAIAVRIPSFSINHIQGWPMATVRLTTKEVQVDSTIYKFDAVWKADAFEAYLAVADVDYCVKAHPPVEMRQVAHEPPISIAQNEENSTEAI